MAALTATDAGWQSHTAIQQNCCTCHLPQIKKRAESERASGEARRRKLFIPAACKMDMQPWQTAASWEAPPPPASGVACGKWKMMPSRREMHLPNELATSSGNVEETSHWISYSAWKVNMLYIEWIHPPPSQTNLTPPTASGFYCYYYYFMQY